jgi:hypothetical protein
LDRRSREDSTGRGDEIRFFVSKRRHVNTVHNVRKWPVSAAQADAHRGRFRGCILRADKAASRPGLIQGGLSVNLQLIAPRRAAYQKFNVVTAIREFILWVGRVSV